MNGGKCLITGCALYLGEDMGHWGDLHEFGDMLIFNAVIDSKNQAVYVAEDWAARRTVSIIEGAPLVENRGIFIFDKTSAIFNKEAKDFLIEWGYQP